MHGHTWQAEGTADRLNNLTKTMVKPKKGAIDLTGSGAEIRALVPFCLRMVNQWEPPLSVEAHTARLGMRHLANCYAHLSAALPPQQMSLMDCALAFHSAVRVLHSMNEKRWQMRPKMHLFMELCAEEGPPSSSWNYREESFGGSVSRQAHHRGGLASPLSMSRSMLTKFCSKESLPRLV